MSIGTSSNFITYNRQDYIDGYAILTDYEKEYTKPSRQFTFWPIEAIDAAWDDYATITYSSGNSSPTYYNVYTPFYGDNPPEQDIAHDDYVLLPIVVPSTTSYINSSVRTVAYYPTIGSLAINSTTASAMLTYFDNPIPANDIDLPLSDYLFPVAYTKGTSTWPAAGNTGYRQNFSYYAQQLPTAVDMSTFGDITTITQNNGTLTRSGLNTGFGNLSFTLDSPGLNGGFILYYEAGTYVNEISFEANTDMTIEIYDGVLNDSLSVYLGSSTTFPDIALLSNEASLVYSANYIGSSTRKYLYIPYINTSHIMILFRATTNIFLTSFTCVKVDKKPVTLNVSGTIKCSQYKWLYDNNFPSQSTPIIATDNYPLNLGVGAVSSEIKFRLKSLSFTPAQQILGIGDKFNTGTTEHDWLVDNGFETDPAVAISTTTFAAASLYSPDLKSKHLAALNWIVERQGIIDTELPQLELDTQYAKTVAYYYNRKNPSESSNFVPASKTNSVEDLTEDFDYDELVGMLDSNPDMTITEFVDFWGSGYSNTVELNLLVMAQNLTEARRVAIEKLLTANAEQLEKLDAIRVTYSEAQANKDALNTTSYSVNYSGSYSSYYLSNTPNVGGRTLEEVINTVLNDQRVYSKFKPTFKETFDSYKDLMNDYNNQIAVYDKANSQFEDLAKVQESLYNDWIDYKKEEYDLESIGKLAFEQLDRLEAGELLTSDNDVISIADLEGNVVESIEGDLHLQDWFKKEVETALEEGEDYVMGSNITGTTVTNKDGYSIAINEEYYASLKDEVRAIKYMKNDEGEYAITDVYYSNEDITSMLTQTIGHEAQHLFTQFFTPLSQDQYVHTEEGSTTSYIEEGSTTWSENQAKIAGAMYASDMGLLEYSLAYSNSENYYLSTTTNEGYWQFKSYLGDISMADIQKLEQQLLDKEFIPDLIMDSDDFINLYESTDEYVTNKEYALEEARALKELSADSLYGLYKRRKARQAKRGE